MVGESQELREFIEASIQSCGCASLVEAMARFADRNHAVPCLSQFNGALAQMPMPLVLDEDTQSLKRADGAASQIELSLAELMSVYDRYTQELCMQNHGCAI